MKYLTVFVSKSYSAGLMNKKIATTRISDSYGGITVAYFNSDIWSRGFCLRNVPHSAYLLEEGLTWEGKKGEIKSHVVCERNLKSGCRFSSPERLFSSACEIGSISAVSRPFDPLPSVLPLFYVYFCVRAFSIPRTRLSWSLERLALGNIGWSQIVSFSKITWRTT